MTILPLGPLPLIWLTSIFFKAAILFARGDGHQAVHAISYGVKKYNKAKGEPGIEKLRTYAASCIYPPAGVKSEDWINNGMPGRKCN